MRRTRTGLFVLAAAASLLVGAGAAILFTGRDRLAGAHSPAGSDRHPPRVRSGRAPATRPPDLPPVRLALSPAQGSIPGLSLDATAPDYDARKLIKLTSDVKAVYESEPRNPAWADAVEGRIGPALEQAMRGIVPTVGELKMECRSTMCKIQWHLSGDSGDAEGTDAKTRFVALQLFPGMYGYMENGHIIRWDDLSWQGDIRDTEGFIGQAQMQLGRSAARLRNRDLSWLVSKNAARKP
jgi:hypothetical protein